MLPKFLKPPMNESFVWVAATLKFSAKTGLHSNEGFDLKVHFNGKCLFFNCPRHHENYTILNCHALNFLHIKENLKC